jgi:CelD/BcsL family acetyltransferase involved in cellulose biosynthesis
LDNTLDLQSYQPAWEALRKRCGGSIFVSFDWTIEWLRHFDRSAQPRVILVEEDGGVVGIAPFVVWEERSMGMKVRKLSLVGTEGSGRAVRPVHPGVR